MPLCCDNNNNDTNGNNIRHHSSNHNNNNSMGTIRRHPEQGGKTGSCYLSSRRDGS